MGKPLKYTKARELRIGNYVYDEFDLLVEFDLDCFIGYSDGYYKPIPLTEDWLLKFGFEKIVFNSDETGYGAEYHLTINDDIFMSYADDFSVALFSSKEDSYDEFGVVPVHKATKYVHQLQNLYFALIGKELTVKTVIQ